MTTTIAPSPAPATTVRRLDRWARAALTQALQRLATGAIELQDPLGPARTFGPGGDLSATVTVNDPRVYRNLLWGGDVEFAEAYMRREWDCDNLTSLIRLLLRNGDVLGRLTNRKLSLKLWSHRKSHRQRANHRQNSRRNILAHYDLGNEFFQLWLDETMAYSCGIFPNEQATMHAASLCKFERICQQLDLKPADHLLDLGCGWAGFAMHAARNYGCRVTGTTISQAQFAYATRVVKEAGLSDRIEIIQQDYRDLRGSYDKIASIEMVEAVGHEFLPAYFEQVGRLLRPGGRFVLQAITIPERHHAQYLRSVDFIQRYIFPGGCLPSVASLLEAAGRTSQLAVTTLEDFSWHYAETLRRWRAVFQLRLDEVAAQGYPDRFVRMWEYYLCYCEAAFMERATGVVQMRFDQR